MSAAAPATHRAAAAAHVSFPRVLRSEWIKLWSLRSTYWNVGVTLVAMVAIALLMASAVAATEQTPGVVGPTGEMVISLGYSFGQIVVAVLGAMMITGEYSTGQIRSSLIAVPTRLPVLAAKSILITVVGFVLGVLGTVLSYVVTAPIIGEVAADLSDPETQRVLWGTGLYLAAVGLLGLGVGALVRHTAGAITLVLGVLLFLPTIVQLLMVWQDWFTNVYPYLPSTAGERIAVPSEGMGVPGTPELLDPWTGFAVLMAYVAVALVAAGARLRRADA